MKNDNLNIMFSLILKSNKKQKLSPLFPLFKNLNYLYLAPNDIFIVSTTIKLYIIDE